MCAEPAVSMEHVPPKCLFPEEKDINTSKFRTNLIKVPSCDLHNAKKSKDDEFLMACLASVVGNNFLGYFHTHTKIKRTILRNGKDFLNIILKEIQKVNIQNEVGTTFSALFGKPHFERLESCFQSIAYGLYYHKFGKRFEGECQIFMDFLIFDDTNRTTFKLFIKKALELNPVQPIKEGANPEVFSYEFYEPDELGLNLLRMTFYQGAKVYAVFKGRENADPSSLPVDFFNSGIKTFFNLPDGTRYEFN